MVIQNLILAMSLSGSVVVLLYLLTYPLAARYFPPKWRYLILKLALVFYLVPLPYVTCRSDLFFWLRNLSRSPSESLGRTKQMLKMSVCIEPSGRIALSRDMKQMVLIITILLLIAFTAVSWYLIRYRRARGRFLKETGEAGADQRELFQNIKKGLGVRQKVRLVSSKLCATPIVMGFFRPVVVLPSKEIFGETADEYMIKHELLHIRNHDLPVKLLGFAALALHWFNPLCYLLYHELRSMGEICCDRDVLCGKGEEARKEYGMLLLDLATEKESVNPPSFISGLLHKTGEREMKRRLTEMKRAGKNHLFLSGLMLGCIGAAGILGGFTYERPMFVHGADGTQVYDAGEIFLGTATGVWGNDWSELTLDVFIPSEYDWFDKDGEMQSVPLQSETMELCNHELCQDGELLRRGEEWESYTPFREGRYEALRCSKCGCVERGEEIVHIPSDDYWCSEDQTIIREEHMAMGSDPCSHIDIPDGNVYQHQREEEDSCVTVLYEGIRCTLCGRIKAGARKSEFRCTHCIHRYKE